MKRQNIVFTLFKSRRLWIALAVFAMLLSSGVAAYYFWWYPNTWRGRFDRVQMGMTEDEVKAILGPSGTYVSSWDAFSLCSIEEWKIENGKGELVYSCSEEKINVTWQELLCSAKARIYSDSHDESFCPEWIFTEGAIYIDFDEQCRVCGKTWLARRQSFNLFDFLKSRLPF